MIADEVMQIQSVFPAETKAVQLLLSRYEDRGMDLADACLVRLSEIHRDSTVITLDQKDFRIYRRFKNKSIPMLCPD
jgi:uncharacterized protein